MEAKKVKKVVRFVITNLLFYVPAYFAIIHNITGARNILYFIIGITLLVYLLALIPGVIQKAVNESTGPITSSIPEPVAAGVDIILVGFFIWHGWWLVGILYTIIAAIAFILTRHVVYLSKERMMTILSQTPA